MAAKTLFIVSMAVAMTMVGARRAYPQEARDQKPLDVSVTVRLDNNAGVTEQGRERH